MSPYGDVVPRQAYGNLWCPRDPAGTYDDEFTADTIASAAWSQTGVWSPTTPPSERASFATGNIRYKIANSWLEVQPPADGTDYWLHKQLGGGLPDGMYWIGTHSAAREASKQAGDATVGLYLTATNTGVPDIDDSVGCYIYQSSTDWPRLSAAKREGGVSTSQAMTDAEWNLHTCNLLIIKDGDNYHCFGCGTSGYWTKMLSTTYGGGATIDRVAIRFQNTTSTDPGNPIAGYDFFRYSSSLALP